MLVIDGIHCGDGAIDDTRIRGWDYFGDVAVNARRRVVGLARSLTILNIRISVRLAMSKSQGPRAWPGRIQAG